MNELRKKLQQKRKSGKGFTLMEMLIVVAIIAILVAIAIPTFNASLEKARAATDQANARTLKSVCVTNYMLNGTKGTFGLDASSGTAVNTEGQDTSKMSIYKIQSSKFEGEKGAALTCQISETKDGMTVTMTPSDVLGVDVSSVK